MTAPTHLRLLRWGAPVVAAAAVAAVASGVFAAAANPSLPAKTAGQLLVDLQGASVDGLSGTVVQDSDLGLPQLPQVGGGNSSCDLVADRLAHRGISRFNKAQVPIVNGPATIRRRAACSSTISIPTASPSSTASAWRNSPQKARASPG